MYIQANYVLQAKIISRAGDWFIECSDARIAAMRFPRGKARLNGAVVHKRMGNVNFFIFLRFYPHICQLSNQVA